ncbi:MAG: hypothetical protein PGN07_06545 [Aeromicrobium erythreum]
MDPDLDALRDLAASLARGAGELARRAAGTGQGLEPDERGLPEVVTDVERRIVHQLAVRHRDHAVVTRHGGRHGPDDARVTWVVDGLDGLANYGIGLELHGVTIGVVADEGALVGVVHDAVSGRTSTAARGRPAEREGTTLRVGGGRPLADATVAWTDDGHDPDGAHVLDDTYRRVLRTGAPSTDWALVASGAVDAVVARPDLVPTEAGLLLVRCAGGVVRDEGPYVVAGAAAAVEAVAAVLSR